MDFNTSRTRQNLMNSFAGESQARNRYTYFAGVAKKAGYEQIAAIFSDTADNEKEHAKVFYKHLAKYMGQGAVNVHATFPVVFSDTLKHLQEAIAGENEEWTKLYPQAAAIADEEGFKDVAESFRQIAQAELEHEKRYEALKKNIEAGAVFKKQSSVRWRCRNCGRVVDGAAAPDACPVCDHPQSFFEIMAENY